MKRALVLAAAVTALVPASAAASGTTTIDLGGKAVKSLRSQGVTIGEFGPGKAGKAKLVLRVDGGLVSSTALLNQRGGLVLRRKVDGRRRSVKLERIQVRLGSKSEIVGRIGEARLTLFAVRAPASKLSLDSRTGSASLSGGPVSLTRRAGRAIKRKLALKRLPRGAFGTLTVDALVTGSGSGGGGGGGGGGNGGGPPSSGPVGDEPPVLTRPASALNVTSAQIEWHVRPSWIRYVNTGEGTTAFGGATDGRTTPECGEPNETPLPLVYSFHFPFTNGWYDPVGKTAGVYFGGGVNFKFSAHGIDLDTKEPEIEINGADSRAIFRFDGKGETSPGNKRGVLVDLDTAAVTPVEGSGTVSYTQIPGTIPQDGGSQSVFAGFYLPGERFGCVSLSLTY